MSNTIFSHSISSFFQTVSQFNQTIHFAASRRESDDYKVINIPWWIIHADWSNYLRPYWRHIQTLFCSLHINASFHRKSNFPFNQPFCKVKISFNSKLQESKRCFQLLTSIIGWSVDWLTEKSYCGQQYFMSFHNQST